MKTALVLGAGGFIGSHMVKRLKSEGYWVRGVDLKYPEFSDTEADEFLIYDLRDARNVQAVTRLATEGGWAYLPQAWEYLQQFDEVYQFAADMGGAGYIFTGEHDADVMHNSATINLNICEALKNTKIKVFYSSSACIYPEDIQSKRGRIEGQYEDRTRVGDREYPGLKEDDAYPASPDSEYGWEKLFSERLYLAYARNYNLNVRIARFHNIFGPEGTYKGGKEKAPAAMCRKVIEAVEHVDVWGDGEQTRSFLYIDDCIDAVRLLMQSGFREPINIGSEDMIKINDLAIMAMDVDKKYIEINHIDGPIGVHGRNSDNTLIREVLNWEPKYKLRQGIELTYAWIRNRIARELTKNTTVGKYETNV